MNYDEKELLVSPSKWIETINYWRDEAGRLRAENAAMRALLERVRDLHIDALSPTTAEDIRAFLAPQEPTP